MTTETTSAGGDVLIMDDGEFSAFLDAEIQDATAFATVGEFVSALNAGEIDDADPAVSEMLVLIGLGRNGH